MPHPARERMVRWLRRSRLGARLVAPFALLGRHGYAGRTGWLRSTVEQAAVDREGNPIPWMTYPAIHLLEARLGPDHRVFEYGCGHSTLWLSRRVAEVVACEHSGDWARRIRERASANVEIMDVDLDDDYAPTPALAGGAFDVVVIDGRRRVECARAVAGGPGSNILRDTGVIVWDDTERERYRTGIDELRARGFRQLPLRGLGPILAYGFETSIFYRADNGLGL